MNYKKIIILGTTALVERENATLNYGNDNCIVIPEVLLDELRKISQKYTERGKNAKKILDYLDTFNVNALYGEGVMQKNGSILRIEDGKNLKRLEDESLKQMTLINRERIQIAYGLDKKTEKPIILVSTNAALRIKAKRLGIKAQAIRNNIFPNLEDQYKGRVDCEISRSNLEKFYNQKFLKIRDIYQSSNFEWYPNLFLSMKCLEDPQMTALGRYDGEKIVPLIYSDSHPYGVTSKKVGQLMLLEALMMDAEKAPLVIVKGAAGTGKTYMSVAAALEQTNSKDLYERILVTVPTEHVSDVGYLPGDLKEKMNPRLRGFLDSLNQILRKKYEPPKEKKGGKKSKESYHHTFDKNDDEDDDKAGFIEAMIRMPAYNLIKDGVIEIQLINYLRGSSITNTIFIIDEAQNIHPDQMKSIITRAGEGSKFVVLGDPTQIDNPDLNERYNGLVYLCEKMKDSPLAWIITMKDEESVRSKLARYAAVIL